MNTNFVYVKNNSNCPFYVPLSINDCPEFCSFKLHHTPTIDDKCKGIDSDKCPLKSKKHLYIKGQKMTYSEMWDE